MYKKLTLLFWFVAVVAKSQNYFPYSKDVPLELGAGFNIANPSEAKLPLFQSIEGRNDGQGASTNIDCKFIENSIAIEKTLSKNTSFHARFLTARLSTSFGVDYSDMFSESKRTVAFIGTTDFGNQTLAHFGLRPEAQKLIEDKKFDDFIERYGTHFVQKAAKGISLYVFLTAEAEQEELIDSNGNGMEGSIWGVGGSFNTKKFFKVHRDKSNVSIKIVSNGPDNFSALTEAIFSALESGTDPYENIKQAIASTLSVYKKENSYTNGYFYSPVSFLGIPKEKIQWNELREKNLVKIKEAYEDIEDNITHFPLIKQLCSYTKAQEADKLEFNNIFKALENYRDSLVQAHSNCLNTSCTTNCCNYVNQNEAIDKRFETCFEKMQVIIDTPLGDAAIEQDHSVSWTCKSDCLEGNNLKVSFEGRVTSANPLWEKLDKRIELECLINGKVIKSFGGKTDKSAKVRFEDALVINDDEIKGKIQFAIRVKKVEIDFGGVALDDKELKFQKLKLKVKIAD